MAFPPRTWFSGQLATAAQLNADVRDNLLTLNGGGVVPVGLIALWGAAASLIPAGWGLCDGGGGRLDLRDVFPIGAGSLYAVGATGGATSVTPATHTTHVVTQPSHAGHTVTGSHGVMHYGAPAFITANPSLALPPDDHNGAALDSGGVHPHSGAALDGTPHAHVALPTMPPYHARAFMQKASSGLSFTSPRTWTTGDVPTAAQFNADLRDNFNYLFAMLMPLTGIVMWGNSLATIPTGWQICDGSTGTPDLRDKFVIGAGGSYLVGATGGAATASLAAHGAHTPTQANNHTNHTPTQPNNHVSRVDIADASGSLAVAINFSPFTFSHTGFGVDAHSTHANFGVSGHGSTGHQVGGAPIPILPPYVALAYIQLVSLPASTTPRTWTTGDTVQANQFNTYVRDNENAILAAQFPIQGVALWSGSVASIPTNYVLPFVDVMVPGAGGVYSFGQTGGATGQTLDAHAAHTVTQPTAHPVHVVSQPAAHPSFTLGAGTPTSVTALDGSHAAHNLAVDAGLPNAHIHAFTVDSGNPHSVHAPITTLPPYKAVAFMERVA